MAEPAPAPTGHHSSLASTLREASTFLAWGAVIIPMAHAVEVTASGRLNWTALLLRVAWSALLLWYARVLRRAGRAPVVASSLAILGSAALDLALLGVTGRSASPLLGFTPVLAGVLPFMAFEAAWIGLAGSAGLLLGAGLLLVADGAPAASILSLANAGGGALVCGWLLARVFGRARRAEEARRLELAAAMASIRTLTGLLPVCAWCRRVRTDQGYWKQIEAYVAEHTDATFTHGVCQDCYRERFGGSEEAPPSSGVAGAS